MIHFLFGRESAGVPENIHNLIKYKLKIPMVNNKRSLNIAIFSCYNSFRKFKTK